jgi:hypothetical protein
MTRPLFRWWKADLGEIWNWRALVSNWRHNLVGWCLTTLRTYQCAQFIVCLSGGLQFWMNCASGREGNELRRRSTVAIAERLNYNGHWMVTTAHTDAINFLRCGVLTVNGEHASDCRSPTSPVCTDKPSSTQYIPAHQRQDLSPRDRYLRLIQHESR